MIDNLRAFLITQKLNINGNRVTTIKDLRNNKKVIIKDTYEDDAEEIALDFFKRKNIIITGKFQVEKELFLLSHNFQAMIK
jgi:hypothetical protein